MSPSLCIVALVELTPCFCLISLLYVFQCAKVYTTFRLSIEAFSLCFDVTAILCEPVFLGTGVLGYLPASDSLHSLLL